MSTQIDELPERTQWLEPDGLQLNLSKHLIDDRDPDVEAAVRADEREQRRFESMHKQVREQLPQYCKDVSIRHEITFDIIRDETRLNHVWWVFCTIGGLRYCKSEGTIYLATIALRREVEAFASALKSA